MDMRSTRSFRSKRKAITPGEETNVRTEHGPPQPARTTPTCSPGCVRRAASAFPLALPGPFHGKTP